MKIDSRLAGKESQTIKDCFEHCTVNQKATDVSRICLKIWKDE
jgi:hypothetical protein